MRKLSRGGGWKLAENCSSIPVTLIHLRAITDIQWDISRTICYYCLFFLSFIFLLAGLNLPDAPLIVATMLRVYLRVLCSLGSLQLVFHPKDPFYMQNEYGKCYGEPFEEFEFVVWHIIWWQQCRNNKQSLAKRKMFRSLLFLLLSSFLDKYFHDFFLTVLASKFNLVLSFCPLLPLTDIGLYQIVKTLSA